MLHPFMLVFLIFFASPFDFLKVSLMNSPRSPVMFSLRTFISLCFYYHYISSIGSRTKAVIVWSSATILHRVCNHFSSKKEREFPYWYHANELSGKCSVFETSLRNNLMNAIFSLATKGSGDVRRKPKRKLKGFVLERF